MRNNQRMRPQLEDYVDQSTPASSTSHYEQNVKYLHNSRTFRIDHSNPQGVDSLKTKNLRILRVKHQRKIKLLEQVRRIV